MLKSVTLCAKSRCIWSAAWMNNHNPHIALGYDYLFMPYKPEHNVIDMGLLFTDVEPGKKKKQFCYFCYTKVLFESQSVTNQGAISD